MIENHKLDRIQIWDTAIMADEARILAVGTLLKTTDHLQPTKSRAEKRLLGECFAVLFMSAWLNITHLYLVYNMKSREVEQ